MLSAQHAKYDLRIQNIKNIMFAEIRLMTEIKKMMYVFS